MDSKIDLKTLLEENYLNHLTLSELSALSGRSLATFKRHFNKEFKTSPHQWIKARRLEKAKELIIKDKLTPSDVYKKVGFVELAHFSKSFKAYFGVNPSKIRKLFIN